MDPDQVLRELRALIADVPEMAAGDCMDGEIASKFEELDAHLSRGGIMPHDWSHRQQPAMIVVESSTQLDSLRKAIASSNAHKLRIWIDGDCVKFKVNEYGWSPGMGRIQEPY